VLAIGKALGADDVFGNVPFGKSIGLVCRNNPLDLGSRQRIEKVSDALWSLFDFLLQYIRYDNDDLAIPHHIPKRFRLSGILVKQSADGTTVHIDSFNNPGSHKVITRLCVGF